MMIDCIHWDNVFVQCIGSVIHFIIYPLVAIIIHRLFRYYVSGKPRDSGILRVYLKLYSFDYTIAGSAQYFQFFSTSGITLQTWKHHVLAIDNIYNFSVVFEASAGMVSCCDLSCCYLILMLLRSSISNGEFLIASNINC